MKAQFNWFPGHMNKTLKEIEKKIPIVDLVIEVVDARAPLSSRNRTFSKILNHKPVLLVISKIDVADPQVTDQWLRFFRQQNIHFLVLKYQDRDFIKKLIKAINNATLDHQNRQKNRGIINPVINVLVIGIPNVGKSTFINKLIKDKTVKVGNQPGVTRGLQFLQLDKNINLIDTPGVLPGKIPNFRTSVNICGINSIKSNVYPLEDVAIALLIYLFDFYQVKIKEFYGVQFPLTKNLTPATAIDFFKILQTSGKFSFARKTFEEIMSIFMKDVADGNLQVSLERVVDLENETPSV